MPDEEKEISTESKERSACESTNPSPSASDEEKQEAEALALVIKKAHRMFTGCYTHGIDSKGRLIVPANFREILGKTFYVAPTPDFKAIALYPVAEWVREQEKLQALADKDALVEKFIFQFNKYSFENSETDAQGRLLLPQKMRTKYLGDAREVEISGAKTHIRIVDSAVGEREDEEFMRDIPDPLAFLSRLQRGE